MISVVVPVYNERNNVAELHSRIISVMNDIDQDYEIIFVDDGSQDLTFDELKRLTPVNVFRLNKNCGQTTAFSCGIDHANGDIIVTLDGDLENRPEDIPLLLNKLNEGYDVVTGWRKDRWSKQLLRRRFPSLIANRLITRMSNVAIHDHGCSLRAYRSQVIKNVDLSGEMHRMILAYLGINGAKIAEIPVTFIPRKYGKSKYGISRSFKVLLDVLLFYFFLRYSNRPMHFFGYAGFSSIFLGFVTFIWALYLRLIDNIHFNRTPLPELVVIFIVIGFQFILMGVLAEIMVSSNSKNGNKRSYEISEQFKN